MIYIYIKRHTDSRSSCTGPYNWTWHIFFYRIFWSNLFIPLKSHVLEILLNSVKGYLTVCGIRCVCFSWVQVIFSLLVLYLFAKFYNFQATSYFQFRQKKKSGARHFGRKNCKTKIALKWYCWKSSWVYSRTVDPKCQITQFLRK